MDNTTTLAPGLARWDGADGTTYWATIDGEHYHEVQEVPAEPAQWQWLQAYDAGRLREQEGMRPLALMRRYLARMGARFQDAPRGVLACAACGEPGADTVHAGDPVHARCVWPEDRTEDPDPTWGHGPGSGPVRC